ncbi:hypothetical protein OG562_12240 [Streptomyces sp. NBC_01275]|uniref:hypothetical protein n=1 Tax=Streptomyces sp. NBC_01275 TaxID=2903807 RepID=UPI0022526534|nr:hypothetical protein [Streptomyces sp. NBC_01275]MCX4761731.1 hypothetical protein [Streptomyces sp. NBC_01275]
MPAGASASRPDRDEHALPAQLNWCGEDGAESAISFQSNMSDFHGCHRAADGTAYEYRGRLNGSWVFPEGIGGASTSASPSVSASSSTSVSASASVSGPHRFRTEEGWGGGWHSAHELRLPCSRPCPATSRWSTWVLDASHDGPIGYRGTPVPAPTGSAPSASSLAADLDAAVQSLTDTAQTLAGLAARLRNG